METTKRNTKLVGDISEAAVIWALIKAGYYVSIPFGENQRYDVLIDDGTRISRVQIKSGRLRNGVVWFNTCSWHSHRGGPRRSYYNEGDYFGVYCRETDSIYFISCSDAPGTQGSLRVDRPKQGQTKKIRWAHRYVLQAGTPAMVGTIGENVVTAQDPQLPFTPS